MISTVMLLYNSIKIINIKMFYCKNVIFSVQLSTPDTTAVKLSMFMNVNNNSTFNFAITECRWAHLLQYLPGNALYFV